MKDRLTLPFCANARGTARSDHCPCTIRRTPELLKTSGKTAMEFCGVPTTRLGWPGVFSPTGWLRSLTPLSVTTLGRRIFHWRFFWSWTLLQLTLLIWWKNYQVSSVSSRSTSFHRIRRLSSSLWTSRRSQFEEQNKPTLRNCSGNVLRPLLPVMWLWRAFGRVTSI